MTPGQLARRLIGDKWFPTVGRAYRRLAVDLRAVAEGLPKLPEGSRVLEVGGGDGDFMNHFLSLNPGVHATSIDIAPKAGGWLSPGLRARVEILPSTSVADLARLRQPPFDMIILSDVIHHIPAGERAQLFLDLQDLLGTASTKLAIKDVEPGSLRARFLYLADRYISADANVAFVARQQMRDLVQHAFPNAACKETDLFERNAPNYCLIFSIGS